MKKKMALVTVAILFVFMLVGCKETPSYEEIEAIVIQCEKGEFHPNEIYVSTANMYLAQENYELWSMYKSLADTNGTYDYNVTVSIDEGSYTATVVRKDQYEIGSTITIKRINTTEYK